MVVKVIPSVLSAIAHFYRMASAKKTSKSLVGLQNSTEKNRNYSNSLQIQNRGLRETSDVGADKLLISKVISFARLC
ncbi:hypothetical protein [Klebsiella quasipneumoniae]|uniref:hypothetical protein n=1 Tax=Klebsiella quasipneumoniae TaxID=1463165 RepID=UPI001E31D88F|nr:hypothetical protein [Klebsiella quasipneumoniae]